MIQELTIHSLQINLSKYTKVKIGRDGKWHPKRTNYLDGNNCRMPGEEFSGPIYEDQISRVDQINSLEPAWMPGEEFLGPIYENQISRVPQINSPRQTWTLPVPN